MWKINTQHTWDFRAQTICKEYTGIISRDDHPQTVHIEDRAEAEFMVNYLNTLEANQKAPSRRKKSPDSTPTKEE